MQELMHVMSNYKVTFTGNIDLLSDKVFAEYIHVIMEINDLCKEFGIVTQIEININEKIAGSIWAEYFDEKQKIHIYPHRIQPWINAKPKKEQEIQMMGFLIHEIAHHLLDLAEIENGKAQTSHGKQWKAVFSMILARCGYYIEGPIKAAGLDKIRKK